MAGEPEDVPESSQQRPKVSESTKKLILRIAEKRFPLLADGSRNNRLNEELNNLNLSLQNIETPNLIKQLQACVAQYISNINSKPLLQSFFSSHGKAGLLRANQFLTYLNSLHPQNATNAEIITRFVELSGGNYNEGSLNTFVAKTIYNAIVSQIKAFRIGGTGSNYGFQYTSDDDTKPVIEIRDFIQLAISSFQDARQDIELQTTPNLRT